MSISGSAESCFLVEWYQPDLAELSFDDAVEQLHKVASAGQVRLLGALSAPSDETFYGVLAADSAEAATDACHQAGWHADRVTAVMRAHIAA